MIKHFAHYFSFISKLSLLLYQILSSFQMAVPFCLQGIKVADFPYSCQTLVYFMISHLECNIMTSHCEFNLNYPEGVEHFFMYFFLPVLLRYN